MTILLLALGLASQTQTVTFEHPCAHSSVVLEALGKQIGRTIKPSGSVNKDYFLVRFDKVPVKEAMDKIAATLNATWSEEKGVLYLGRMRKQEEEEFYLQFKEQASALQSFIAAQDTSDLQRDEARSIAMKLRDFPDRDARDASERLKPLERMLPGSRAMFRLLRTIDLFDIVLADGSPLIYSRDPSTKPYPVAASDVFAKLKSEWAMFAEEAGKSGLGAVDDDLSLYIERRPDEFEFANSLQLAAHVSDDGVLFMLAYNVDNQWKHLGYERFQYQQAVSVPAWMSSVGAPAELSDVSSALTLEEPSNAERAALVSAFSDAGATDIVLKPASEAILQAARLLNVSVVAHVPDVSFIALNKAKLKRGVTVAEILTAILTKRAMKLDIENKWLSCRPIAPYEDRRSRVDRPVLKSTLEHAVRTASLSLDDFCKFVSTTRTEQPVEVFNALLSKSANVRLQLPSYNLEAYRIFGLLTKHERDQAAAEGAALSPRPDSARFLGIIGTDGLLAEGNFNAVGRRAPFIEEEMAQRRAQRKDSWTLQVRTTPFFVPLPVSSAGGVIHPYDVQSLAVNMESAERNKASDYDFGSLAEVSGTTLTLSYGENGGGGSSYTRFFDPFTQLKFGPLGDLPKAHQHLIVSAIERRRSEVKALRGGG